MAKALVFPENRDSLEAVLSRDRIKHVFYNEKDVLFVEADASNHRLKVAFEDAACERQKEADRSGIPVYSLRTLKDPEKLARLRELNGTDSYRPLERDAERVKKEIWGL